MKIEMDYSLFVLVLINNFCFIKRINKKEEKKPSGTKERGRMPKLMQPHQNKNVAKANTMTTGTNIDDILSAYLYMCFVLINYSPR